MSWKSRLHKLTTWDTMLQIAFVVVMVIVAVVIVSVEACNESQDRTTNVGIVIS